MYVCMCVCVYYVNIEEFSFDFSGVSPEFRFTCYFCFTYAYFILGLKKMLCVFLQIFFLLCTSKLCSIIQLKILRLKCYFLVIERFLRLLFLKVYEVVAVSCIVT